MFNETITFKIKNNYLKMMFAIAMVPGERVCKNIKKTWNILNENYGINFISSNSGLPYITLISGLNKKKSK